MSKLLLRSLLFCGVAGLLSAQDAAPAHSAPPPASAAQAQSSAGLPGKWHIVLDTPGGDRELDADLKVSDGQVTGKWGTADVAGTFKDGKLNLDFPFTSEEVGATAKFKVAGTLDGDSITGTWEFTEYNGTLKGTRTKADSGS